MQMTLTARCGAGERERAAQLALDGAQAAQDVVRVPARARRPPPLRAPRRRLRRRQLCDTHSHTHY